MLADVVFDALRPFHLWAQIAAVCALALGAAALVVLVRTRRWWPGAGIFALCLLVVAFGGRARGASYDLYPFAVNCMMDHATDCAAADPSIANAQLLVTILGVLVLAATVLGLATAGITLYRHRGDGAWHIVPGRDIALVIGTAISVLGSYLTADGIANWIQYAYLADMSRAGDGLGQIPLVEAIIGTIIGVGILAVGLALVIGSMRTPRQRPAVALQ